MKENVRNIITKVYLEKDYEFFVKCCKKEMRMSDDFYKLLKTSLGYTEINLPIPNPSKEWYVYFDTVTNANFSVKYNSVIKISKIVPVFNVQHEFEVENRDEDRIGPSLDGYSGEAYCKNQFEFHEKLKTCLQINGLEELSYAEMNEVICGLDMPKNVNVFGNQMTVDTAIFKDVLDLC